MARLYLAVALHHFVGTNNKLALEWLGALPCPLCGVHHRHGVGEPDADALTTPGTREPHCVANTVARHLRIADKDARSTVEGTLFVLTTDVTLHGQVVPR